MIAYVVIGDRVDWPVEVRTFKRRNGGIGMSLTFKGGADPFEEEF